MIVVAGERAAFVDVAIRRALTERQRRTGAAGALPAERLDAIAQSLDDLSAELRRHLHYWGEPS